MQGSRAFPATTTDTLSFHIDAVPFLEVCRSDLKDLSHIYASGICRNIYLKNASLDHLKSTGKKLFFFFSSLFCYWLYN